MDDSERRLAHVVDEILRSYSAHGNINHLDGSNLPSRAEVSEVLDDLIAVMFPGFFGQDHLDELTSRYFVGERCARCLRRLEKIIVRAIGEAPQPTPPVSDATHEAHEHAVDLLQAIPELRRLLVTDVQAALTGDPAACNAPEVITSYPGIAAIAVHRIAHHLYTRGVPLIPRMMSELVHGTTGIDIHPGARIGESFFIDHGTGVVIGETTVIGTGVKLYQGVTLGAMSVKAGDPKDPSAQRHPTLEDEVTVYSGATILGGETVIGKGAVIGGNVWLTQSVPPKTTVMLDKPSLRMVFAEPTDSAADWNSSGTGTED